MLTKGHPEYDWRDAQAPVWPADNAKRTTGRLRACNYCGSMHPTDLFEALKAGAQMHWADFKYGWPHKSYVDSIPNPHAGLLESRSSKSDPTPEEIASGEYVRVKAGYFNTHDGEPVFSYWHKGAPASPKTGGKFYTVHLLDATPEEANLIHKHMGMVFTFENDQVTWGRVPPEATG